MRKCFVAVSIVFLFVVSAGESYGMKAGSFEISPFIAVTERYSDNVRATNDHREGDFSTVISPGIQLTFPRVKRKYGLELKYQMDIEKFSRLSTENAVSHTFSGKFGINFPVGLELLMDDTFRRAHDPRGTTPIPENLVVSGVIPPLDFFNSNLFHVSAAYAFTDRYKLQLDYSNYVLRYGNVDSNGFRNYMANTFAGYLFFRVAPKTSVFGEYEYVIIEFDQSARLNSKEHHFFAGLTWDVTGKTQGTIKGGFGLKDFNDASKSGFRDYIFEIAIHHNLTSRDTISIIGSRATHETNLSEFSFFVETGASVEYSHRFTGKITGKAGIGYFRDSYSALPPQTDKTDDIWRADLGLSYQFKRWLLTEAGYSYTIRNSSDHAFDYSNDSVYIRVVGTL